MSLSTYEVKAFILDLYKKHSLRHTRLSFKIRDTQLELYGSGGSVEKIGFTYGGVQPLFNVVSIVANHHKDTNELNRTLQHEIFGHVAINYLRQEQKLNLLTSIEKEFKNPNSDYQDLINKVEKSYPDASSLHKAEEIFCYIAENTVIDLQRSYRPFGTTVGNTKQKIENIVQNLAAGIRENRLQQQIFPKNNNDLGINLSLKR